MTRRDRLMATLRGEPVDRPAVCFYEIGGWRPDCDDPDEFNVYNHPSWRQLVELAETETDIIRFGWPAWTDVDDGGVGDLTSVEHWEETGTRFTRSITRASGRELVTSSQRNADTDTNWTTEHLLKSVDDVRAYLELPVSTVGKCDVSGMLAREAELGDRGIVSVEFGDPLCSAAGLFSMADYTVFAMTEKKLFHRLSTLR